MSLTSIRFSILVALLGCAAALAGWRYGPPIAAYMAEAEDSTHINAKINGRAIVYRITQDRPLSFIFTQPVDLARIIAQPAVTEQVRNRREGFIYALRIRLFDTLDSEIANHEMYLHADSPDEVFASGERFRFFRNRAELVAEQDDLLVENGQKFARIEIELLEAGEGMVGLDMRLYERRSVIASQAAATYYRRSDLDKEALAEPNAFPRDMLTDAEIENLGRNWWRPVGPLGIPGEDYVALVLYEGIPLSADGEQP